MHAITKARYPGHQIRPDECTSLIAIPAQANQVFLKYRLRSPLGRTGSARRPKLSLAFSGQPTRPRLLVRAETEPVADREQRFVVSSPRRFTSSIGAIWDTSHLIFIEAGENFTAPCMFR
jgi:hypothetical protein